jgi:hypothetical protein
MRIVQESKLQFTFDDNYELIKADENVNIKNVKQFLPNTKDMDLLGFYEEDKVFFMEIKNFRGAPLEDIDTLTNEVAQKLRDTIAIIAGASSKLPILLGTLQHIVNQCRTLSEKLS